MKQYSLLQSYIFRAEQDGTRLKLKLQNIQSGEQQLFTSWAELVNYVNRDLQKVSVDSDHQQEKI